MSFFNILKLLLLCLLFEFYEAKKWSHHEILDCKGKYHLYWRLYEDHHGEKEIAFKVVVEALGYVGFGFSLDGYMPGSDIVTGWVKHGRPFLQDRHATRRGLPKIDKKQDYILKGAFENCTHTILEFSRKFDTCDDDDIVIDGSTMRIIYAYSDKDPIGNSPFYHFKNRGSKMVLLLRDAVPVPDKHSLLHWDVTASNFDVSPYETIYWCKIFKSPPLHKKHHVVRIDPLIQKGHESFVHHMTLYECLNGLPEEYEWLLDSDGHDCYGEFMTMPEPLRNCVGSIVIWGMGGGNIIQPKEAGLPLHKGKGTYYKLEIHYDNPQLQHGLFDNSGMRLYYTPKLRKYDSSALAVASSISPRMFMPPRVENYVVVSHSSPECLDPVMPKHGIKIFNVFLHTHLKAKKIRARHYRHGTKEITPLAIDDNYDYRYQKFRNLKEHISFLPGDQITIECTYNTTTRYVTTFGGSTTRDEMCGVIVGYYPRLERRYTSMSVPEFSEINDVLNTNFKEDNDVYSLINYNWSSVDIQEVEKRMRYGEHESECILGNGEMYPLTKPISYPDCLEPYVPPESTCEDERKHPFHGTRLQKKKMHDW